ncbi:MAG: DNA translocase FtsK 4TM domain-containing protein [Pyrinomonadaceae bacterium]
MAAEVNKKQTKPISNSRSNEIVAVALAALAILVFLCLVTYNPNDYVPFISPNSNESKNWIGVIGASVAGILFQTVGLTALLSPFLIGLFAWRCYKAEIFYPLLSHIIGFVLFVISLASLLEVFGIAASFDGSFRAGGLIGYSFAELLSGFLGSVGAGVLLLALLAVSVLLLTNLPFSAFFRDIPMIWQNFQTTRLGEWLRGYNLRRRETSNKATQAQAEKRRAAENKANQKTPNILTDNPAAIPQGEKIESVAEKVPAIFKHFENSAKSEESREKIQSVEQEIEEQSFPTISVHQEPAKSTENEWSKSLNKDVENKKIPFTQIRETGELNGKVLAEVEELAELETDEKLPVPLGKPQNFKEYILPTSEFLNLPPRRVQVEEGEALALASELEVKTKEFNATGRVVNICPGPVVTTYEYKPDPGVKYSRITGLSDDLCLALKAESIRINRIPGKAFVGIEVPNRERDTIYLREVVESKKFNESNSLLTIALGKTIDGLNYVADLAKMPHLLIAGATGAGKSVGVNTLVVSILYKAKPDEVKFIMVDPKRLELGLYADIPHLATPIITDPKRAAISLKWAVSEMEKRYKELAVWGVRNIDGFNVEVEKRNFNEIFDDNGDPHKKLPYIVIIIDELADLMMVSGKEVEESITRLAQMARAVGIHLVLATQRPSVDVITGLIKANFPARISFRVSSKVDSRTIIDGNGAESLLGRGDMLFLPPATSQIIRVHGAFVDEKEIHKIVEHVKAQGRPEYDTTITKTEDELIDSDDLPGKKDVLFADALRTVVSSKRASTSLLQRHLRIGYGRAAAILDAMVREGYIGEMDGSTRARPILQKAYDDLQEAEEGREL